MHKKRIKERVLTFTNRCPVHDPDQGGTIFTVCGDAVLGRLENVAIVLFHLEDKGWVVRKGSWCSACCKMER